MRLHQVRGGAVGAMLMMLCGMALAVAVYLPLIDKTKARVEAHRDLAQQRLERALEETSH